MKRGRCIMLISLMAALTLFGGCVGRQPAPSADERIDELQPEEPLVCVSYSVSNGESNTRESFEMYYSTEKQRYVAEYTVKGWDAPEKTYRRYVKKEKFDGLVAITERYRVWHWTDPEKTDIEVLDGDSYSLVFSYGRRFGDVEISLGSTDVWPEGARDALQEIKEYIMRAAKGR